MKLEAAHAIADAVLMEGYALYPYRASAPKNRYRWTFGVLAPRAWSEAGGCEAWWLEAQVLVAGERPRISAQLRFFQIERRRVEDANARELPCLDADGELAVSWDEGIARTIDFDIPAHDHALEAAFEGGAAIEPHGAGQVIRERRELRVRIVTRCERVPADRSLHRITIRVENVGPCDDPRAPREQAVASALASCHLLIGVSDGELLSAIDPPTWAVDAAAACKSVRTYPVLLGQPGASDLMLAAPFILYDHPQVAPESAGDLCDATEIDELLLLRTRTMTDDEKRQARATDPRTAQIIERADALSSDWLARMHGATRDLCDQEMVPQAPRLVIGAKVRLGTPTRRTDAQDILYAGRIATIAAIKHDVDGTTFYGVTVDDDPAADLNTWFGRFHYYRADELEAP